MTSCPFCNFKNEDGAIFCEQCKSDLSSADVALAIPMEDAIPMADAVPEIPVAEPFSFEEVAQAIPVEEVPSALAFPDVPPEIPSATPIAEAVPVAIPEPIAEAVPVAIPEPMPVAEAVPVPAPVVASAPVEVPPPAPVASQAPVVSDDPYSVPSTANPRLQVLRGQRPKAEYPIMEGLNFMGRADEKPVDIDLEEQENPEKVWCSRQHAVIELDNQKITIEDLNSSNGTFLNRNKIYPGQKMPMKAGDVIQIGSIQMKVLF